MRSSLRNFAFFRSLVAMLLAVNLACASDVSAQNLFSPVVKVNDLAITRYEIEQRARMLALFRAPGDPKTLARQQLIEDRLKLDAARASGFVLEDQDLSAGMEEFAGRANMTREQFIRALAGAGVAEPTFREFVRAGITWREISRSRFASRVAVSESDLARAKAAVSGRTGVRVLLSEIIMPVQPGSEKTVQERAARISHIKSESEFSAQARRYSAAATAGRGGRLNWMPITNLPAQLRSIILGLAPGDVSDPLPIDGAVALFQLRDVEEEDAPQPEYSAIEYATFYIDGGRSDTALARAESIKNNVDTCDDLYGIAKDLPPEVLERQSKAPEEIPQDIAIELAKLDPGEVSANLTRANGQTLALLMLCGRSPKIDGEGPSSEQLAGFIRDRRLNSFANGYLEQLRAEARIVELE